MGQSPLTRAICAVMVASCTLASVVWLWPHLSRRRKATLRLAIRSSASEDPTVTIQRILYEVSKQDSQSWAPKLGHLHENSHFREINYRVVLALNKGLHFHGVVIIKFNLRAFNANYLSLDYRGTAVKYARINGREVPQGMLIYHSHEIRIPHSYCQSQGENEVEVVFESKYSFFDSGMASLFWVDEAQKYSLRQQVIFLCGEVERAIPCINCLNPCRVSLQVLHPENFQIFSNTLKSIRKYSSFNDYPQHKFLLDTPQHAKETSRTFETGQNRSSKSSQKSVTKLKSTSHFYAEDLPTIHSLSVCASDVTEVRVSAAESDSVLIRCFCKPFALRRVAGQISHLYAFIRKAMEKLEMESHIFKVDILLLDDPRVAGYFAPGLIYLQDQSFTSVQFRYLAARALLGILLMKTQRLHFAQARQIIFLNGRILRLFPEFRDYIFLKNVEFKMIRQLILNQQFIVNHSMALLSYFSQEVKYILKDDIDPITSQVVKIQHELNNADSNNYWAIAIAEYNSVQKDIGEEIIKVGLKYCAGPTQEERNKLKQILVGSNHCLDFYSDKEIQEDLDKMFIAQVEGLQRRLPLLCIASKFKQFVTKRYEAYLPVRENIDQVWRLYYQFRKFEEEKNFHHYQVLEREINRIVTFIGKELKEIRLPIHCDLAGWRLLSKLKIMPQNSKYYNILSTFIAC